MNAEEQKNNILKKLQEQVGKANPYEKPTIISNANSITGNDTSITYNPAKDVEINAKMPELPKDVLAPSSATDEKAYKEWMANLRLTDPTKYKIEYAKQQYLDKMKEMSKLYSQAQKQRDKRRQ